MVSPWWVWSLLQSSLSIQRADPLHSNHQLQSLLQGFLVNLILTKLQSTLGTEWVCPKPCHNIRDKGKGGYLPLLRLAVSLSILHFSSQLSSQALQLRYRSYPAFFPAACPRWLLMRRGSNTVAKMENLVTPHSLVL